MLRKHELIFYFLVAGGLKTAPSPKRLFSYFQPQFTPSQLAKYLKIKHFTRIYQEFDTNFS
jgi:hypothetical protein